MTATLSTRPTATDRAGWFNRRLLTRTAKSSMVGHHYFFPSTASLPVTHPLSLLSPTVHELASTAPPLLPHCPSPLNGGARNEDQPCASSPVPCLLLFFPRFQKPAPLAPMSLSLERRRLTWPLRTYPIGRLRDENEASFYYECRRDGDGAHF